MILSENIELLAKKNTNEKETDSTIPKDANGDIR